MSRFFCFSPLQLTAAGRYGMEKILIAKAPYHAAGAIRLRDVVHNWIVSLYGSRFLAGDCGPFNLFAWQAVWVVGPGSARVRRWRCAPEQDSQVGRGCFRRCRACSSSVFGTAGWGPTLRNRRWNSTRQMAAGVAARDQPVTFTVVVYWMRPVLVRLISIEPFLTLGKASLRVFCAHLFFVFVGSRFSIRMWDRIWTARLEQLHGFYCCCFGRRHLYGSDSGARERAFVSRRN